MSYTPDEAKPLLDSDEYQLFSDSFDSAVEKLTTVDLKLAIRRCRSAQDKYRDLQEHQATVASDEEEAEARGVALKSAGRTVDKVALLAEAMARYEQRLAAVE